MEPDHGFCSECEEAKAAAALLVPLPSHADFEVWFAAVDASIQLGCLAAGDVRSAPCAGAAPRIRQSGLYNEDDHWNAL